MKEFLIKIEENKFMLTVDNKIYEKEAILNATYRFTDKCFINIEQIGDQTEIYFLHKENVFDLEKVGLEFGNELIDQQVRLITGREFKNIREQLVKKAFSSINK